MIDVSFPADILEAIEHAGDVEHAGFEFASSEFSNAVFMSTRSGSDITVNFESHRLPEAFVDGVMSGIFSLYPFLTLDRMRFKASMDNLKTLTYARQYADRAKERAKLFFVSQRTPRDCSLCCFAMAMRLSYDDAVSFVRAVNDVRVENGSKYLVPAGEKGWCGEDYEIIFEFATLQVDYQPRNFRPREPAIFSVRSRVNPDGFHAVYYENGEVYDPTTTQFPYTTLQEIFASMAGVYQWINAPVRNPAYPR